MAKEYTVIPCTCGEPSHIILCTDDRIEEIHTIDAEVFYSEENLFKRWKNRNRIPYKISGIFSKVDLDKFIIKFKNIFGVEPEYKIDDGEYSIEAVFYSEYKLHFLEFLKYIRYDMFTRTMQIYKEKENLYVDIMEK